jgi:hypothetical protein
MYKNIPTGKLIDIIRSLCYDNMMSDKLREEIVKTSEIIIK